MADERLDTKPRGINDAILDAQVRHMVFLERFQGGFASDLISTLDDYDERIMFIVTEYVARLFEDGLTPVQREKLLSELEAKLKEANDSAYASAKATGMQTLSELVRHEMAFQAEVLEKSASAFDYVLPALVVASLSRRKVKNVAERHPVRDLTAPQWFNGMRDRRLGAIVGEVRSSLLDGISESQVLRNIRGRASERFKDGVLGKYRRSMMTFSRTAVTAISSRTLDEFAFANAGVVKFIQWVSVLDSRTSPVCIQRDGKLYEVGKGPRPPAHYNCRSRVSYVVKGEQKPHDITFPDWLKGQNRGVVEEVLGKTRSELYLKGNLPVKDMIARDGRFIRLDELKQLERQAFDKAGLGV